MRKPARSRKRSMRVVILGAGGNSLAIADAILAAQATSGRNAPHRLVGFLDDLPRNRGATVLGFPVLGPISSASELRDCWFINGIASVDSFMKKPEVIARSQMPIERFVSIVHPGATVSANAVIGNGTAILVNSVVCPDAKIGSHVIMLQNSSVNHHSVVCDHATISAGVTILGYAEIGESAFIGGGSSIAPYVKVGGGALVGMGAVVIRDVAAGTVVAGNPARPLAPSKAR
jgi:sugar O-acyltransferase (sialic acid O-acetyltransferase NeuD family)